MAGTACLLIVEVNDVVVFVIVSVVVSVDHVVIEDVVEDDVAVLVTDEDVPVCVVLVQVSVDVGVDVAEDEVVVTVSGVDDKVAVVVDALPAAMKYGDAAVSPGHNVTMPPTSDQTKLHINLNAAPYAAMATLVHRTMAHLSMP